MSSDGAHHGVGAERALKTILGGDPQPTEEEKESIEEMRSRILSAPIESKSYDGTATACARLILEAWAKYPALTECPLENMYLMGKDGQMVLLDNRPVVLVPGVYEALKRIYEDRPEAMEVFDELTGFMWGWAVNAALRCMDLPPEPNPAIVEIGPKR